MGSCRPSCGTRARGYQIPSRAATRTDSTAAAERAILRHLRLQGRDRVCAPYESLHVVSEPSRTGEMSRTETPPKERASSAEPVNSVDGHGVVHEERGIEDYRRRHRQHPDADADSLGLSNSPHIERQRQRGPDQLTAKAENA